MDSIKRYMRRVTETLEALPWAEVERVVEALHDARLRRANVFVCGNGGSAATAAHLVNDLNKGAEAPGAPRFRAVGLTDNVPLLTAWSNDAAYADAFAQQLRNLARPGDLVIGISGSGNSANVLNAVCYAREIGATTVGLTGRGGGKLASLADIVVVVPNACMEQIEDVHLLLEHAVVTALRERAQGELVPSILLADGRGASPTAGAPANAPAMRPAVFLDRDGTINANRPDHIKCWSEFALLPGALDALRELAQTPLGVALVSNQAGINRQLFSYELAESIMRRLMIQVADHGGRIDAAVWCPHRPDERCRCRKPETGMFTAAAAVLHIDLARSYVVGDAEGDIAAGQALGCKTILVLTGRGEAQRPLVEERWRERCTILPDLAAAVRWIIEDVISGARCGLPC